MFKMFQPIIGKLPTIGPKPPAAIVKKDNKVAKIQLGDLIRDSITGFEGIADARMEFLNKCVRWQIQPQALHEGVPVKPQVFDEDQLIIVKAAAFVTPKALQTGGNQTMAGGRSLPSRY